MAGVETRLESIECQQREMKEVLNRIELAVCGSDKDGIDGLVKKVKKHDDYIEFDKKQKWLIAGGISVLTFIIGSIAQIWDKLFK